MTGYKATISKPQMTLEQRELLFVINFSSSTVTVCCLNYSLLNDNWNCNGISSRESLGSTVTAASPYWKFFCGLQKFSQYLLSTCEESGIVLGTVGDQKKNKDSLRLSDT